MRPDPSFWRGKRILLTGHTGFKGAWLALWLHRLGAHVTGVALPPVSTPNLHQLAGIAALVNGRMIDIRDAAALRAVVQETQPQIVLHLAAQALVRESYRAPLDTLATNVMGSANLLDALRGCSQTKVAVMVTTDKVYRNSEWPFPYREDDPLGGHDPYSASKAAAEIVSACYRNAFLASQGVAVATARAGNVIGGGDWSAERLLPDAMRAWQAGMSLFIRRPHAVRPWQHVLDPLAGYLRLAQCLWERPELANAYNFGPLTHEAATVGEVISIARNAFGSGEWRTGDCSDGPHEAGWLALEVARSRTVLGVAPHWSLAEAVRRTVAWYREAAAGVDARALCDADITKYEAQP